jgi:hypothetical protein
VDETLNRAHRAQVLSHGESLLEDVRALRSRARELGEQAEKKSDIRAALLAVRELTRLAELHERVLAESAGASVSAEAIAKHPAWNRLQGTILRALEPYPEAQRAIADALRRQLLGGP